MHSNKGPGSEYTGWLELPKNYDKDEFTRIKAAAKRIQENSEVLIVIGIGGSYLGTKACIQALTHSFYNDLSNEDRKTPQIYYVGINISSTYFMDLFDAIEGKDISINLVTVRTSQTDFCMFLNT